MSNAAFLSRLRSLSLLLLLQVILATASPTRHAPLSSPDAAAADLRKRAGQFPDFPADYDGRVQKGAYLRTLMPVDNAAAATANGGASVVSPYQDPAAAAQWGWSLDTWWYPYDGGLKPSNLKFLTEALKDPAFPVDEKTGAVYYHDHDKRFKKANGETGEPSMGSYSNVVNPAAGALIFDVNMSPRYAVKEYGLGDVPDMDTLSDFAFFQWLDGCEAKKVDPKSLKVVFRAHITYGPTYNLVLDALKEAGHARVPGWEDRVTFKMGTRGGDAVLGSTHGSGTAWMLIQHKDALGVKEITEAVVWGVLATDPKADTLGPAEGFEFDADRKLSALNIRFTIKDA